MEYQPKLQNATEIEANATRTYRADSFLWGATIYFPVDGHTNFTDEGWQELANSQLAEIMKDDRDWVVTDYEEEER